VQFSCAFEEKNSVMDVVARQLFFNLLCLESKWQRHDAAPDFMELLKKYQFFSNLGQVG